MVSMVELFFPVSVVDKFFQQIDLSHFSENLETEEESTCLAYFSP